MSERPIEQVLGWTLRESGFWSDENGELRGHATVFDLIERIHKAGRIHRAFDVLSVIVREIA